MSIWSEDHNRLNEGGLYDAVKAARGLVPELHDKAGLRFCDLSNGRLDYEPVIRNMRVAFDLLQKQVL
jgi:hypothetical protein